MCMSRLTECAHFPAQADMQYEDQKKKEAMAMKYWEQKKIEEQVRKLVTLCPSLTYC